MQWVEANLPDSLEYQEFLDRLATADKPDWATWLLAQFGSDESIKTVTKITEAPKHIFATGSLVFKCAVSIEGRIEAGRGIEAGWGIETGGGIITSEGIQAGWGIQAGLGIEAGWGIEAGFSIKCELTLSVGTRIFAGLCGWRLPQPTEQEIHAKEVIGTIATGEWKRPERVNA